MFTGIVQGTAEVVDMIEAEAFRTHVVRLPEHLLEGLALGASVAHNGVCLTVTAVDGDRVSFDLMRETLRVTNLGAVSIGDRVNIERAARFGDEIGGHAMSGHVMAQAELVELDEAPNNRRLWFLLPEGLDRFVFTKGLYRRRWHQSDHRCTASGNPWRCVLRRPDSGNAGPHDAGGSSTRRQGQYRGGPPDPGDCRDR